MRQWGGQYKGVGLYWPLIAREKKSVTLDLRRPAGQEAFRDLAATADVVIENFRPGTFEQWNLGWNDAAGGESRPGPGSHHRLRPDRPVRDKAGFGVIGEAMSGFRHLSGEPGRPPVRVGISIGDALAGTQGFIGALLALLAARAGRPRGQVVDVALYEAMWMYMESILPEYDKLGTVRQPTGPTLPGIAPSNVYPTADGQWAVIGANQDKVFTRLAVALGRPDWAEPGSGYTSHVERGQRQEQLDAEIAAITITLPAAELVGRLDAAGVPAGLIYTAADIAGMPISPRAR